MAMTATSRIRKAKRSRASTASSSSAGTEQSKQPKDVLELGEHLVRELNLLESTDTLARWMAHHIAELMETVKKAKTPEDRRAAQKSAAESILKIWSHRQRLPGDAYPLARYREILKVLDR